MDYDADQLERLRSFGKTDTTDIDEDIAETLTAAETRTAHTRRTNDTPHTST